MMTGLERLSIEKTTGVIPEEYRSPSRDLLVYGNTDKPQKVLPATAAPGSPPPPVINPYDTLFVRRK